MANQLDDVNGPVMREGRDINVIAQKIPVTVGVGSVIFEICLWLLAIPGIVLLVMSLSGSSSLPWYIGLAALVAGLIVPLVYLLKKTHAGNYLMQVEQKIQKAASTVDNYLEQRVQILQNATGLVEKAIDLDKTTFKDIAALRSGVPRSADDDEGRNEFAHSIGLAESRIRLTVENYPQLQAHNGIMEAMKENQYLQKEITAAREVYNDTVLRWNTAIFEWPCKQIVAAKRGYTTRIPFSIDEETKARARSKFF